MIKRRLSFMGAWIWDVALIGMMNYQKIPSSAGITVSAEK